MSPMQRGPLDVLLGRWTLDLSPAFIGFNMLARLFSPYDLNPGGANPLRDILQESIDFERLADRRSISSSRPPTCARAADGCSATPR